MTARTHAAGPRAPAGIQVYAVPDPRAKMVAEGGGGGKGGGGGGGSAEQHQPNIAPNTLRSLATVRILEALCEGPVFGPSFAPVSIFQSIYLDDTPIVDAAGNAQFHIKEAYFRAGLPAQDAVPGYPLQEAPFSVNVQVHTGAPVVRTLNTPLSAVRYILRFPAFYAQTTQGDVTNVSVTYAFDIAVGGGPWINMATETVTGKTMSPYERAVRVNLPWTTEPIQARIVRFDPEPADGVNNNFFWSSYVEITDGQIAYDDTCIAAMTIDAEQFSSPPKRSYLLDGLIIDVPSNYDSRARTYDGDWDGTFKQAWTNNPAWVLYALLVNKTWGLGKFLDVSMIDKWSFYECARYNDELVPDGKGGLEPRWTCNCMINTRQDAYTVLNAVASSMLALLYWSNGTVFVVQDRALGEPTRVFTPADVEGGTFDYQGADYRSRWTAAAVTWNDPSDQYNAAVELVQDNALIGQQGYRETQKTAFACTVRGQAQRFGRWLIYTNQFETEAVTFRIGLENADVRPGELIAISDPSRVGARLGGRLLDDDGTDTLTLDAMPDQMLTNPAAWTLYVVVGAASDGERPTVFGLPVLAVLANNQVLVSGKQPGMVAGSNWMASSADVQPTHWRVAHIADQGQGRYEVLATEHHEEKFSYVDNSVLIPPPVFSLVPTSPTLTPPSDLRHQEYIYLDGSGTPQFGIIMSWQASPDPRVTRYMLELSGPAGDYRRFPQIATVAQDVPAMRQGEWMAVLRGFDNVGRRTAAVSYTFTPVGLTAKPMPPSAVYLTPQGPLTTITWIPTNEIDVSFWWVKWSPVTDGTGAWATATTTIARVARETTQVQMPTRPGTIMVKAIDSLGQESEDPTLAILLQQITDRVEVASIIEQPAWAGDMGEHWHSGDGELRLPPPDELEPSPPDIFPGERGVALNKTPTRVDAYGFAGALDLGIVCQVSMISIVQAHGDYLGFTVAQWEPVASVDPLSTGTSYTMTTWTPLASAKPLQMSASAEWDAHIEARVSQDAVNFSDWFPLKSTIITGRAFEWRLIGTIYDTATTLRVHRGEVQCEVPTRAETGNDILLDATGHATVSYPVGFLATPSVQLTARQGLAPGGNIVVTESDRFHFKVEHRNAAGAAVPGGSIDYLVQGYGGYA